MISCILFGLLVSNLACPDRYLLSLMYHRLQYSTEAIHTIRWLAHIILTFCSTLLAYFRKFGIVTFINTFAHFLVFCCSSTSSANALLHRSITSATTCQLIEWRASLAQNHNEQLLNFSLRLFQPVCLARGPSRYLWSKNFYSPYQTTCNFECTVTLWLMFPLSVRSEKNLFYALVLYVTAQLRTTQSNQ